MRSRFGTGLPPDSTALGLPSFVDYLAENAPDLLPRNDGSTAVAATPHGTTILALRFADGVLMAGDRRATAGNVIASSQMRKVYEADAQSAIGIAGTAGLALELVRLFQLELEHFEKIEGSLLSLEGKANRLATMIRGNLGLALHGLAVSPVFAGWDETRGRGRIFSYDVTGGCYEERDHHCVGSGALYARGTLKGRWEPGLSRSSAVELAVQALIDVAEEDAATAGPDPVRGIWPLIATVTARGYMEIADDEIGEKVDVILAQRQDQARARRDETGSVNKS
ncbi:MAG TPA: proteasome subunit beta [Actinomycetales bacterium]|nr:proteasome subunit beta [Actinomycetales bacterium]